MKDWEQNKQAGNRCDIRVEWDSNMNVEYMYTV